MEEETNANSYNYYKKNLEIIKNSNIWLAVTGRWQTWSASLVFPGTIMVAEQ